MSRADQISWWIDQGAAMRGRIAEGMAARRHLSGSWLDEDVRRGKGERLSSAAVSDRRPALTGATITGQRDEERSRSLRAMAGSAGSPAAHGHAIAKNWSGGSGGGAGSAAGMQGSTLGRARLLAAGYQPAVVKVVSYARGSARATATGQYIQRDDVPLETHDGRMLGDRESVAEEIQKWSSSFSKRAESHDVGDVRVTLHGLADTPEGRAQYAKAIAAGFAGHRHAWRLDQKRDGTLEARVVFALAGVGKQRFRVREERTSDEGAQPVTRKQFERASATLIRDRISEAAALASDAIAISPVATSHGREGVIYRLRTVIGSGPAVDDRGQSIANAADVKKAAREWGPTLRSQSSRDTMHLILSAKSGTPTDALTRAARNFLQDRFADHKFMFGLHTDKEADGHIHVHAVIAVKSESGRKIHPGRDTFNDWRKAYAEHAQVEGLKIVATAARERASSQSYGAKDKAIVDAAERPRSKRQAQDKAYSADPANSVLISRARQRIAKARSNPVPLPTSDRDRQEAAASLRAWTRIAAEQPGNAFARDMQDRLEIAHISGSILQVITRRVDHLTREKPDMTVTSAQMIKDLRLMNEAVSRTSDLLSGETKQQFLQTSARYLETLANRIDLQRLQERGIQQITRGDMEAIAGDKAERLIASARELQKPKASFEASGAPVGDDFVQSTRQGAEVKQRDAETNKKAIADRINASKAQISATSEKSEVGALDDVKQSYRSNRGQPASNVDDKVDTLTLLRREQEQIIEEIDVTENESVQSQKTQQIQKISLEVKQMKNPYTQK